MDLSTNATAAANIQPLTPDVAWQTHHRYLDFTRPEFDAYLDGSPPRTPRRR